MIIIQPPNFRAWFKAMGYKNLTEAANALGMKRRQVGSYHAGSHAVPATVQLAMLYIQATGQDARSLKPNPPVAPAPKSKGQIHQRD